MPYFGLKEGVFLVCGAARGALLDTHTENVYSLNTDAVTLLTQPQTTPEVIDFWQKLAHLGLAEAQDEMGLPPQPLTRNPTKPTLDFIWFEINSDDCNERCIHCYADSAPVAFRKPLPVAKTKLTHTHWKKLIQEGYDLGCRACQFIGGEPFLYRDEDQDVLDLAEYAQTVGYEYIEIFTNATLITPPKIERIRALGLHIAVSLYSDRPEEHDRITNTPGSHAKTVGVLQKLKEVGVPTRVEVTVMKTNETRMPQTLEFIDDLGFTPNRPDPLRPKGRGDNPYIMPSPTTVAKYGMRRSPNFKANRATIEHYRSSHSCLSGKVTITTAGEVLPCIFSRQQVLGHVTHIPLTDLVEGQAVQQTWQTTKDDVLVCKDCEYRYVCFDCRPLSEAVAQGRATYTNAPYPRCTYNPYTGEWGQGVWRVAENGELNYIAMPNNSHPIPEGQG